MREVHLEFALNVTIEKLSDPFKIAFSRGWGGICSPKFGKQRKLDSQGLRTDLGVDWPDENVLTSNIDLIVIEKMRIDNCKMKTAK